MTFLYLSANQTNNFASNTKKDNLKRKFLDKMFADTGILTHNIMFWFIKKVFQPYPVVVHQDGGAIVLSGSAFVSHSIKPNFNPNNWNGSKYFCCLV